MSQSQLRNPIDSVDDEAVLLVGHGSRREKSNPRHHRRRRAGRKRPGLGEAHDVLHETFPVED